MPSVSSWLLGFISIEKLVAIKKPIYKSIFAKKFYQIGICGGIFLLNVLFNFHIFTLADIYKEINSTTIKNINYSDKCDIALSKLYIFLGTLYFITASILPFAIMFTCSIYLVIFIFKSRRRAYNNHSIKNKRILKKDLQFILQTLSLDVLFLILNTPLSIARIIKLYTTDFTFGYVFRLIYYVRFFLNFFIYLLFNSIFRNEFLLIIGSKQ